MRVLWLCNIMLPAIADHLHLPSSNKEGWLTGLSSRILAETKDGEITLGVCFPVGEALASFQDVIEVPLPDGTGAKLYAYGFYENTGAAERYDDGMERRLQEILQDFAPDVVHCFGTEYPHTLAMTRAFGRPERTLIGIQGLCSVYADHYRADLPEHVWKGRTFRDVVKRDSLQKGCEKYRARGKYEIEAVKNAAHVTGRTPWDRHYTNLWNPGAAYHFMNETLRSNFYGREVRWSPNDCEEHSIFVSQGDYPIKGLHYLLQAMPRIVETYPDTQVYVAGNSIIKQADRGGLQGLKGKLKLERYGAYILELLREGGLTKQVHFLGSLNAEQMKERYLHSHVFLCPSSIENSPNSVGEAMLLGMPVVCARVGGIEGIFCGEEIDATAAAAESEPAKAERATAENAMHSYDGIFYRVESAQQLADAICRMFEGGSRVASYCSNARVHAKKNHDPETNYRRLLEIYREIVEK